MPQVDVGMLMNQDFTRIVAIVLLVDDNMLEVAEGGYVTGNDVQGDAIGQRLGPSLAHQAAQVPLAM